MAINIRDVLIANNGSNLFERLLRSTVNGDDLTDTYYAVVLSEPVSTTLFEFNPAEEQTENKLYTVKARILKPYNGETSRHFNELLENPCLIEGDDNKRRMLIGLHTEFEGQLTEELNINDIVLVRFKHHTTLNQKTYNQQKGELLKKINNDAIGTQRTGASALEPCADGAASLVFGGGVPVPVVPPPAVTPPTLSSFLASAEYESTGGPVIQEAKRLGFQTFDKEPFRMFIFGIRGPNMTVDFFDDTLGVAYIDRDGKWHLHYYAGTTDPGAYYTTRTKNGKGVATSIMAEGQYVDAYEIGLHNGKYQALVQKGSVAQYLDRTGDNLLDFKERHTTKPRSPGLNIHASVRTAGQTATRVGPYSAGCQVHATADGFESMMTLARLQVAETRKTKFTYTLMKQWWP